MMKNTINYKNIIFDLGGVILKDKPICVLDNFELDKDIYDKLKNTFFSNWHDLDLGLIDLEEHFRKCNLDINKELKDYVINYYRYRPFNEEVIKIIKKLKKSGYKIFILSDNNIDTKNYLNSLHFFQEYIDGSIYSCDYGITKDTEEIYKILINKYTLNPLDCLFIDDKKENIKVAEKIGIRGYVFTNKDDLIKVIEKL